MLIDFEKWHGCHNDFLLVKLTRDDTLVGSLRRAAPALCRRDGSGVGADGIIAIVYDEGSEGLDPTGIFIINSDGSLAANCGNGLRCVAMSLFLQSGESRRHFDFKVFDDLKSDQPHIVAAEILAPAEGRTPLVALAMGVPTIGEAWPLYGEAKAALEKLATGGNRPWLTASWGGGEIGNPHVVIPCETELLGTFVAIGQSLQSVGDGLNVHLVAERQATEKEKQEGHRYLGRGIGTSYEMKTYERGAGETAACGSGACLVAAIALSQGLEERNDWLRVVMPGGAVYLHQPAADEPVLLAGPASVVFRGVFDL